MGTIYIVWSKNTWWFLFQLSKILHYQDFLWLVPFERERISCKYINVKDNFRAKEKNLILNYNNKKGINHVCFKLERLSLNLFNYIFLYDMKGMWVLLSYLKPNLQGQGVHLTHPLMNFTWVNPTQRRFQKLFSGQLLRT